MKIKTIIKKVELEELFEYKEIREKKFFFLILFIFLEKFNYNENKS